MIKDSRRPADDQDKDAAAGQDKASMPPGAGTDGAAAAEGQEMEALRAELEAMKDKYLRALADFKNYQKRAADEYADAALRGQSDLAKALLPVLDDFERTTEAAKTTRDVEAVVEGVRIVHDQLLKVLSQFGLERMRLAKGDVFDPTYHHAVAQHATDEVEPQRVLHVPQAGYTMRDRLLRPATVVVAKALPLPREQEQVENG